MSDTKTDISGIKLSSTAFPTSQDLKVWHSLTAKQQAALIDRDIEAGLQGAAVSARKDDLISEVLGEFAHAS